MKNYLVGAATAAMLTLIAGQALADPVFTGSYSTATVNAGVSADLVFTTTNDGVAGSATDGFTYTFQAGLTPAAGAATVGGNCGGAPTANVVGQVLTVANLPTNAAATACTVTVSVSSVAPASYGLQASALTSGPALINGATPNLAVLPTITSLNPTTGLTTGGTSVTITGLGFTGTTPATGVFFGATNATGVVVNSNTSITAVAAANAAGPVRVRVENNGQTSADTAADDFTYSVPIPTLSEWAMILFGAVLAGAAALVLHRRRLGVA